MFGGHVEAVHVQDGSGVTVEPALLPSIATVAPDSEQLVEDTSDLTKATPAGRSAKGSAPASHSLAVSAADVMGNVHARLSLTSAAVLASSGLSSFGLPVSTARGLTSTDGSPVLARASKRAMRASCLASPRITLFGSSNELSDNISGFALRGGIECQSDRSKVKRRSSDRSDSDESSGQRGRTRPIRHSTTSGASEKPGSVPQTSSVQGGLSNRSDRLDCEGLIALSRVMRILRHLLLPEQATNRRVQKWAYFDAGLRTA